MGSVFIFCHNNFHKLAAWNNTNCLSWGFCRSESVRIERIWFLCSAVSQGQHQGVGQPGFYMETVGENPLPSSFRLTELSSCGYRTEAPFHWWLTARGLSAPWGHPHSLSPPGSSATTHEVFLRHPLSLTPPSATSALFSGRESSLLLESRVFRSNPLGWSRIISPF